MNDRLAKEPLPSDRGITRHRMWDNPNFLTRWSAGRQTNQDNPAYPFTRMEGKPFAVSVVWIVSSMIRSVSSMIRWCIVAPDSVMHRHILSCESVFFVDHPDESQHNVTSIYDSECSSQFSKFPSHRHPTFISSNPDVYHRSPLFSESLCVPVFNLVFLFFFFPRTVSLFPLWRTTMSCILWMLIAWSMYRVYVTVLTTESHLCQCIVRSQVYL